MSTALDLTIETLAGSRNEAATEVLVRGLESGDRRIFDACLAALVARRSKAGHLAVLERWHTLSPSQLELLRAGRGRMGAALRAAVVSNSAQLVKNGYEFALAFCEFDLLPTLVTIAEQKNYRKAEPAMALIEQLVGRLSHLTCGGRDAHERRDPHMIARTVLDALERSVERYRTHKRDGLIEAFVTLAGPKSPLLLRMIDSPHHPCYGAVMHALTASEAAGIVRLLTQLLSEIEVPASVLGVVSHRDDPAFVAAMLSLELEPPSSTLRRNLARVQSLPFLEPPHAIDELPEQQQAAAMRLLMLTGADPTHKLMAAENLLQRGAVAGRLAACRLLAGTAGDAANRLVMQAVEDEDPTVQAAAARQLRDRHIPGAMSKLVELAQSANSEVAAAAREGLQEFSFENYLLRYDALDNSERQSAGQLALQIDPEVLPRLRHELESASRRARLRALEIIEQLDVAARVADALVERLTDVDHLVRSAAAEALRHCTGDDVRDALLASLSDRSVSVQRAAQASLAEMGVEAEIAGPRPQAVIDAEEELI